MTRDDSPARPSKKVCMAKPPVVGNIYMDVAQARQRRGKDIREFIERRHPKLQKLLKNIGTTKFSIEGWEDEDSIPYELDIDTENDGNTTAFRYFGSIPFDRDSPFMQHLSEAKFGGKIEDGVAYLEIRRDYYKGKCTAPKQPGSDVTITEYERDSGKGITFTFESKEVEAVVHREHSCSVEEAIKTAKQDAEFIQDRRYLVEERCESWPFDALKELMDDCDPELTSLKYEITTSVLECDAPDYISLEMFTLDVLTAIKACVEHHDLLA